MPEKKNKERLIFTPGAEDRILEKDGKKYRMFKETTEGHHIKGIIFEEYNEKELDEKIDKIAEYLTTASKLDAKMIVKDVLRRMDTSTLDKIENQVNKEEPVDVVPGCLNLKIGKREIWIV